jgi:hypothetical protein
MEQGRFFKVVAGALMSEGSTEGPLSDPLDSSLDQSLSSRVCMTYRYISSAFQWYAQ